MIVLIDDDDTVVLSLLDGVRPAGRFALQCWCGRVDKTPKLPPSVSSTNTVQLRK